VLSRSPRRIGAEAARDHHRETAQAQRRRLLSVAVLIAATVTAGFGVIQLVSGEATRTVGLVNLGTAVLYAGIPLLYRFGELVAPLVFVTMAYLSMAFLCWQLGTGTGIQFYFLTIASAAIMVVGAEQIRLTVPVAAVGVSLIIALQFAVPRDTGVQPGRFITLAFVVNTYVAGAAAVGIVWYGLRQIANTEAALEKEHERSEALLTNILPIGIAERLKQHPHSVIADKYEDASVLFADIAGYTKLAGDTPPEELVEFLDTLYTRLDALVIDHGLEKIKTSGDAYMAVGGIPDPHPDHLDALADLALDITGTVAGLVDSRGRTVPMRIGVACGPVVAGVVGSQRFFYDVWGDTVNVASRMESTGTVGRVQVPQVVRDRLCGRFVFEERGHVDIKGKGVMHTWYLVGRT
jgi:adenylate cyclase